MERYWIVLIMNTFIDGLYKVTNFDVIVMVTGNAGVHEPMSLPFGELLMVKSGDAIIGARITVSGQLEKLYQQGVLVHVG